MAPEYGRKLNALEIKIHQIAVQNGGLLTQKEVDALAPDVLTRTEAINFLLGAGILKAMEDQGRRLLYRAVTKDELALYYAPIRLIWVLLLTHIGRKKDMGDEERMVLSYIQAADNQGIWTKHLRAKTQLHQTVLDRCLKQLTQKQIIKAIKGSAKYPTRKIFMMAPLEPSVELTGGPWYTDGELDIEFVRLLRIACLRFIQERSFLRLRRSDNEPTATRPLYPISSSPAYPTAQEILKFITKSKITETELAEEHVEMLLNVLILDGEIEKLPAHHIPPWATEDNDACQDDDASSDDEATRRRDKGKDIQRDRTKGQKRKHRERTSEESDSGNERAECILGGIQCMLRYTTGDVTFTATRFPCQCAAQRSMAAAADYLHLQLEAVGEHTSEVSVPATSDKLINDKVHPYWCLLHKRHTLVSSSTIPIV